MVTSNPAEYYHFDHLGWLAPGYQADVLCFDDLSSFEPARVWQAGRLVAMNGARLPGAVPKAPAPDWMRASVHLETPAGSRRPSTACRRPGGRARVIGVESRSLTTRGPRAGRDRSLDARWPASRWSSGTGARAGSASVTRTASALSRGAIASTVAHDAHNCMVVGALDQSGPAEMAVAVARLAEIGGGQVAVRDGRVLAEVRLPDRRAHERPQHRRRWPTR